MAARKTVAVETPESAGSGAQQLSGGAPAILPLDVMLGAMRALWAQAEALKDKPKSADERLALIRQASAEAHKAAVYVHAKLASVDSEEEGAREKAGAMDKGKQGVRLGSRELARRLLFAVAFAEEMTSAAAKDAAKAGRKKTRAKQERR